ncbi:MAG TPA: phosphatidylinositol mannoside acyltransferase [Acidimicrobiales bacterium]
MDFATPAYKTASALARHLPRPLIEGGGTRLAGLMARRHNERRRMVESHQRRVQPDLDASGLRRQVTGVYRSYGRYWAESFRLPSVSESELAARMTVDGYEHFEAATSGELGPIAVLPHLGSWEWVAYWLARIKGFEITAVVEQLEPPALFEWFQEFRRTIGMHVVPLGPEAGGAVSRAIKAGHVVALLSDRDIAGGGVMVEFFGEKTTLPAGPATLALRTRAPLLPVAVYDDGNGMHRGVVRPPLSTERRGSLREDVARLTQDIAESLEELIRAAPEQWHLMQPNWPSDRTPVKL